ncbi:Imm26 family immunity protein [Parasegetibacter sp. NRK P23]|uniref:Imm26 family immunity protein n=1 Tax=Parasegetibacter sp. NRK P23 TaxID=2942999 RepID=UPI0020442B0C|nr:Imm26 family immunity protein [Parasegetibacter sp. NRK P23]MCM5530625.1 immunity 26/phosphotriesterase HocA family protein [Parasegetibacter sp. NRK P23]
MLTNSIRRHFGIKEIDKSWKRLEVKDLWKGYLLIDNANIIQKLVYPIKVDNFSYREVDYEVQLNSEFKIVGKRGKVQPLTASTFLKIKPEGKFFDFNETTLKLINYSNGVQLFNEYDLVWSTENEVLSFLNDKICNPCEFDKEELNTYLNRKKQVNQKAKQGDIFRVKLAKRKFAYGRVIADLIKFVKYDTGIVGKWEVDWRGRNIFNEMIVNQTLVDFYQIITDDPNLKFDDLNKYKTTPSVSIIDSFVKHEGCIIIDNSEIEPSSFDLPMTIDTYYQYVPICHIFKWGCCVVTFEPDKKIEKQKGIIVKKDQDNYNGLDNKSTEYYINSCIQGSPNYAFLNNRGDLRYPECIDLRKIISRYVDFDINTNDYDSFARKYGFMDRQKILAFTKD